ncbi:unnamed protein product [Onchocerca flexuosa]|uniref:Uncharacterized protein n=1 Tax=Onchocerca flexuosa TaxID=387005 RepID=A0A183I398_9BILA|nr:unnamed protein product [Onchocerca flexuosa]
MQTAVVFREKKRETESKRKGRFYGDGRVVRHCVPLKRSALLSAGKRPVGVVGECVVVLVNCPLDPDDPYLIALCLHYLCNDHI